MGEIFKVLNLVLKFALRNNIKGDTYSWIQATYLKLRQNDGVSSDRE